MISLVQLWLPILVAAIAVFVASSLVHMVFKWHASDYKGLSNEDDVRAVVRAGAPGPGQYFIPFCPDKKEMGKPRSSPSSRKGRWANWCCGRWGRRTWAGRSGSGSR